MPGSSNTSFIPKRNPAQKERQGAKRQVFVGTFVIRVLFFASLLAAIGVFVYEMQLKKNVESEILALDAAIGTFNEAEMQRVLEADARLKQAKSRFQGAASMVALLRALERSTAGSIQISQLALERITSNSYDVEADMKTETFDSVLFQRSLLEESGTFAVSEIKDLVVQTIPPNSGLYDIQVDSESLDSGVSFKAILSVATDDVPHGVVQSTAPVVVPVSVVSTTTEAAAVNTDTI